jgi:hypothetical protein
VSSPEFKSQYCHKKKKEVNPDILDDMDEPKEYYAR